MESRKIDMLQGAKIVIELTPEQLEALTTEAARKALEQFSQKDEWDEVPEELNGRQAAKAINMPYSTFMAKVDQGVFIKNQKTPNSRPFYLKSEIMEYSRRIVAKAT